MSTYKYLDESGLSHVHSLINTNKKLTSGVEYIVGTQSASTNAWTGVSTDTACKNSTLYTGKVIIYHLPYAGTSSTATLNLTLPDGTTTGAKTIYRLASTTVTTTFASGCDILMVYNGTNWKVNAYVDTNTNTIGYQLRTNSAIYTNKTGYSMNRYSLFFEVDGGLSGASTTIGTGTSKTTIAFKYIPGGVIKYNSTSGAVANGSNFTATGLWDQYVLDLRYTFNIGSTLTSGKPVYMRCVVNSDGTLSPNYSGSPSHPIVQALPTTADGYVYVYLGQAYSTTNIELVYKHPIYEYKDGKIREWQYDTDISGKQDTLVSGTNIKTINGNSLLGSGNITISSGTSTDVQVNGTSIVSNNVANLVTNTAYNSSTNKLATMNDIPSDEINLIDNSATNVYSLQDGYYFVNISGATDYISFTGLDLATFSSKTYKIINDSFLEVHTYINDGQTILFINVNGQINEGDTSLGHDFSIILLTDGSDIGFIWKMLPLASTDDIPSVPTKTSDLTNDSGFITGISSSDVTTALGYTPYNSTNPNGYTSNTGTITGVSINGTSIATSGVANIVTNTAYNSSTNKIATMSDLPSVPTKVSDLTNDAGYTTNTGTVTSIATSGAITGGTITSSGTISHSTSAGYKHIPSGGSSGQYLKYSASGTATWTSPDSSISSSSTTTTIPSSKAVWDALPSVPSAGTTASAVSTTASGGSASTYSKSDHVHNITSSTITSALGYTPYNSTNPNGYTTNTGTITGVSINNTSIATSGVANLVTNSTYNASTNKIATMNDIPLNISSFNNDVPYITADDYMYTTGDVITESATTYAYAGGGFITGSKKSIVFTIPIDKPSGVSIANVDLEIVVRQNGYYLVGSASTWASYSLIGQTVNSSGVTCELNLDTAPSSGTNNDVVGIALHSYTITFV